MADFDIFLSMNPIGCVQPSFMIEEGFKEAPFLTTLDLNLVRFIIVYPFHLSQPWEAK